MLRARVPNAGSVYRLLHEGRADLVEYVVQTLGEEKAEDDHAKLVTRANAVVLALALSAAYGIVKRISFAVGHQSLTQTYARVEGALGSTATRLVTMSIRLDQIAGFPRGEIVGLNDSLKDRQVAKAVLQWLALTHINLFPVNFQERQRVCSALGIKYRTLEGVDQRRKLVGPAR